MSHSVGSPNRSLAEWRQRRSDHNPERMQEVTEDYEQVLVLVLWTALALGLIRVAQLFPRWREARYRRSWRSKWLGGWHAYKRQLQQQHEQPDLQEYIKLYAKTRPVDPPKQNSTGRLSQAIFFLLAITCAVFGIRTLLHADRVWAQPGGITETYQVLYIYVPCVVFVLILLWADAFMPSWAKSGYRWRDSIPPIGEDPNV